MILWLLATHDTFHTSVLAARLKVQWKACHRREWRDTLSFKYGDNNARFQTVSPGGHSWFCTELHTWKVTETELEREVHPLAPFSPTHSWLISAWSGYECLIGVFGTLHECPPPRSDVKGEGVLPKLCDHQTSSSDKAYLQLQGGDLHIQTSVCVHGTEYMQNSQPSAKHRSTPPNLQLL